ncbi:hypothetical protein COLO4_28658 [Corchorus olitorius]|uniref:Uncharacterized protein n=1 Tax=Corchorus olitorius TaxID=93759 RepID=A0A1R3HIV1_9ROSI|nr:hypothetical protein COLO4_28658 [Corchorus olitorius]
MGYGKERLSWRNSDGLWCRAGKDHFQDERLAAFSCFYALGLLIDTVFLLKYACLLA